MAKIENAIPTWPGWETVRLIGRGSFGAVYEIQRNMFGHREKAALRYIRVPQSDYEIDDLVHDGYDEKSIISYFEGCLYDIERVYSLMPEMKNCANVLCWDEVRYVRHENGVGWDIYIKMELLTPLPKTLGEPLSEAQVIRIGADLSNALACCEKRNLIHRDIKPANIFVAPDGTYKLGDIGNGMSIKRIMNEPMLGACYFMAPEIYNNQPYSVATDIYSLGLVLYWLLNDRRMPFQPLSSPVRYAQDTFNARMRLFRGEPIPAPLHGSPALQQIVLKACAFDPKDRYRSAEDMLRDLNMLKNTAVYAAGNKDKTNRYWNTLCPVAPVIENEQPGDHSYRD